MFTRLHRGRSRDRGPAEVEADDGDRDGRGGQDDRLKLKFFFLNSFKTVDLLLIFEFLKQPLQNFR